MQGLQTKNSYCPYCGEPIELIVDTSVPTQEYIEDCQVCCQPISVHIMVDTKGFVDVITRHENE